jgi:hypothetical protein
MTFPTRGIAKTLFGVACGSLKHRSPVAFATPQSAATFWADCADRAKKADETTIFAASRK